MEGIIIDYISQELVSDLEMLPLSSSTNLMDSSILDSVAFLNLVLYLEEQFGIKIPDTDLTRKNFETIDAICAYVQSRQVQGGRMAS